MPSANHVPSLTAYQPGRPSLPEPERWQLQFHRSRHPIRLLVLGNGAGKTTAAGAEADYWLQGHHPHQPIPKPPHRVLWVCKKYDQWDEIRVDLETWCLTAGWAYNETKHRYTWPNGSALVCMSDEGTWENVQGIPPPLVIIDEECDPRLWRELLMRRRAHKKTRYVIPATATKGKRWMYHDIHLPWLKYHAELGMTLEQAMHAQLHPDFFVWPKGGILTNPACDEEDLRWQQVALANASPAEQRARMEGGFHDLQQSPVFDVDAVAEIASAANAEGLEGTKGVLVDPEAPDVPAIIQYAGDNVLRAQLPVARRKYSFLQTGGEWFGGTLTIWEPPRVDALYVEGADFAQGLETGDHDCAIVCRAEGTERLVQVAELHGHYGQTTFPPLMVMLAWFYNQALLVGEANSMGLGNLRWAYEHGYVYQYFREQKPDAQATPKTDRLGYWKGSPLPINYLQWAIAPRVAPDPARRPPKVLVRGAHALEELSHYAYRPRRQNGDLSDTPDEKLVMEAEPGYHDDRVSALAGCVIGWRELPRFRKPQAVFVPGSLGAVLGHTKVLNPPKARKAFEFAKD